MRSVQFERCPFENRPPTIGAHTQKFYGGYERLKRQPIELRLSHGGIVRLVGRDGERLEVPGRTRVRQANLDRQGRPSCGIVPGGLKLTGGEFARCAVRVCGLAQDSLRSNT